MGRIAGLVVFLTVALLVATIPIGEVTANPTTMSWFRIKLNLQRTARAWALRRRKKILRYEKSSNSD